MTHDPYNFAGPDFDGETYEPDLDKIRLKGQLKKVFDVMKDSHWRTLHHISVLAKCPESSAGARLRDCRKRKFGGHIVDRKRDPVSKGLYLYRLVVQDKAQLRLI